LNLKELRRYKPHWDEVYKGEEPLQEALKQRDSKCDRIYIGHFNLIWPLSSSKGLKRTPQKYR
jgi:hypothetical protein